MKQKLKTSRWDIQDHLKTERDMRLFIEACFEEAGDDPAFIAKALGEVARARGMTDLARQTGIGRDTLYKALSGQVNPSLGTILKVTRALGLRLTAVEAARV
jgi:probable addiction module antidote protein